MARGIPVNQNLYPVCTPGLEGKVVESKGNKNPPLPTNQQENTKTNTHITNIRCAKRMMGVQVAAIRANSNVKQFERRGPVERNNIMN